MREHKYRMYDTKLKKYVHKLPERYEEDFKTGDDVKNQPFFREEVYERLIDMQAKFNTFNDRIIYEQFSGVADVNETECFEGDVCTYTYYIESSVEPDSMPTEYSEQGVVEFMHGTFAIKEEVRNEKSSFVLNYIPLFDPNLSFKIIGNIHEEGKC